MTWDSGMYAFTSVNIQVFLSISLVAPELQLPLSVQRTMEAVGALEEGPNSGGNKWLKKKRAIINKWINTKRANTERNEKIKVFFA